MKKIITSLLASAMMTMSIPVMAEEKNLDIFNNDLFEIMGEIKEVESSDSIMIYETIEYEAPVDENGEEIVYEDDETSYTDIYHDRFYANGDYVRELLFTVGSPLNVEIPTENYPAFMTEPMPGVYIMTEYVDDGLNIYLVGSAEGEMVEKILIFEERYVDPEDYSKGYNLYAVREKNGEQTRELLFEGKDYDDFYKQIIMGGKDEYAEFNDGLKPSEAGYALEDINGNVLFETEGYSYSSYDYNLGYVVEWFNNMGGLDWSDPDLDSKLKYSSHIRNVFTNETYDFENMHFTAFRDSGYTKISTNDNGKLAEYIVKVKNPALVTVFLDGKKIKFDQIPVIDEGRTLVPLRAIFEAIGAEVEWDGDTKTITATDGKNNVKLIVDNTEATVNGETVTLDVPAKLVNGRTMVPARFIADSFGVTTDWDGEMKQVILTTK